MKRSTKLLLTIVALIIVGMAWPNKARPKAKEISPVTEKQIQIVRNMVRDYGFPLETKVNSGLIEFKYNEQKEAFPEYCCFHHWMEPGENTAAPTFTNDQKKHGKYLIFFFGPTGKDRLGELPYIGEIHFDARDITLPGPKIIVKGFEVKNLNLSLRLVQGDKESKQVTRTISPTMEYIFPDFTIDWSKPLRFKVWVTGHLS